MIRQLVSLVCALTLSGVFAASALGKLRGRVAARHAVRALTGLKGRWVAPATAALVAAEALLAAALLLPPLRTAAAAGSALLLAAFTGALARVLHAGTGVACACFGRSVSPIAPRHLVRNLALLAAAVAVAVAGRPDPTGPAVLLLAAAGAALPTLAVVFLDEAADLLRPVRPAR